MPDTKTAVPPEPDQEWHLRGAAFGFAFEAMMMSNDPTIPESTRQAYRWAEAQFVHLAKDSIGWNEAASGYGG